MTVIKRTKLANRPKSVWVSDDYIAGYADTVHVSDYLTHSPVLDRTGKPLEYESRPAVGFNLFKENG